MKESGESLDLEQRSGETVADARHEKCCSRGRTVESCNAAT